MMRSRGKESSFWLSWRRFLCRRLFITLFLGFSLLVHTEELFAYEGSADDVFLVSGGQTEVRTRVEAADEPDEKEPDEEQEDKTSGHETEEEKGKETEQTEPGGTEIKTADQNAALVPVILFLLSGIILTARGIKVWK